jgi:hypothetical protein
LGGLATTRVEEPPFFRPLDALVFILSPAYNSFVKRRYSFLSKMAPLNGVVFMRAKLSLGVQRQMIPHVYM